MRVALLAAVALCACEPLGLVADAPVRPSTALPEHDGEPYDIPGPERLGQPADRAIHVAVQRALVAEPDVDATAIHVTVEEGDVTLAGVVGDLRQRERVQQIVEAVPGVRRVTSGDLWVRNGAP